MFRNCSKLFTVLLISQLVIMVTSQKVLAECTNRDGERVTTGTTIEDLTCCSDGKWKEECTT